MTRPIFLAYGVLCHALFLVTYALMASFVGGFGIGWSIDAPPAEASSAARALAIDLALLLLFALPHSFMARAGFKRVWTRIVPAPFETST